MVRFNIIKSFLISLLCLISATTLFAGNPVTVKSGSISVLKNPGKALLEVDWSATRVGDQTLDAYLKGRGEDWVRDWPRDKETAASYFKSRFNKKSKGMKVTSDVSVATHKIVIHVKSMDVGNAFGTFMPFANAKAGGVSIIGTIDVVDMTTNQVLCVLYVDEVKGEGGMSETARMGMMFDVLAKKICKLK
jgi:hypothetical protein